ncbi:hypothetical protein VTI74DRAFT_11049 [Chaetomium olivicolor]
MLGEEQDVNQGCLARWHVACWECWGYVLAKGVVGQGIVVVDFGEREMEMVVYTACLVFWEFKMGVLDTEGEADLAGAQHSGAFQTLLARSDRVLRRYGTTSFTAWWTTRFSIMWGGVSLALLSTGGSSRLSPTRISILLQRDDQPVSRTWRIIVIFHGHIRLPSQDAVT